MSDCLMFDSYPIISFLREEKGFQTVENILKAAMRTRSPSPRRGSWIARWSRAILNSAGWSGRAWWR